jgi:uncharacterized protein
MQRRLVERIDDVPGLAQRAPMNIFRSALWLIIALALLGCRDLRSGDAIGPRGEPVVNAVAPAIALAGRVTDAADILDEASEGKLTDVSAALEAETGHQLVVVTVPSLGGRDIADFTRDLGNAWGIGREEEDDGVLLLVAPNERKVRIAVGFGIEDRLTDEKCSQIIQEEVLPHFRVGDFAAGIENGVGAIRAELTGR